MMTDVLFIGGVADGKIIACDLDPHKINEVCFPSKPPPDADGQIEPVPSAVLSHTTFEVHRYDVAVVVPGGRHFFGIHTDVSVEEALDRLWSCYNLHVLGNDTLLGALMRSEYDVSTCMGCGQLVICIPDGMPCCEKCGETI